MQCPEKIQPGITYDLQNGNVLLPPQILLHFGSHRREQIVGIHNDVYERVDEAQQGAMAAGKVLHADERAHGHQCVMIQMQERDLTLLLAQHKEHGVQQFADLGNVVKPHGAGHLQKAELLETCIYHI